MDLTLDQQTAVECIDHNLQIIACAGSGVGPSNGRNVTVEVDA